VPGGGVLFGKQMRKCFIAKPGYKIVGVDSASCQLRMLAARMGDDDYTHAVVNGKKEDGTDVHNVNRKKAGLATRGQAKTFIYGFLFGGGDPLIGNIVGGGKKEGKAIKAEFLSNLPMLEALIEKLTAEWQSNAKVRQGKWGKEYYNGWFIGLDGRPIFCASEHMVLVYALQSDEAILMQTAAVLLYDWCTEKGWTHGVEYGFVANVHDEIQAEVRDDIVEEYSALAERAISQAGELLGLACPHEGEADVGNNWYETH
jgi:DNA polymerase I-like protein with 3'-5' exonuclease and polymerase domains